MMDVMSSVQLGSAMGGSDEPDPRLEFPKFQKDELIAFRSKVEANGDLTFDKVLAGPLGFYLFSSWAARDAPPCAKHAMYFVRDVVKLREACGAKKISKADADLQSSFVPFNAAKFRKNDKYTGTSMRRKAGAVVDDALYAQHVSTDAAAPFPIAKVAALVDASAAAQAKYDIADALCCLYVEKACFSTWLASDSCLEWLRFMKIQMDLPPRSEWFQPFRTMGRGGFGLVRGCRALTTGQLYAMKEMEMKRIKLKKGWDLCRNEHWVLTTVDSPFTVGLSYAYKSPTHLVLIMDLMMGGDLSFQLKSFKTEKQRNMPEAYAAYYLARTILGLEVLHAAGILYRDLKPENVLVHDDGRTKLSDMGLATSMRPGLRGMCGTLGYAAPEMFQKKDYGFAVDWWSLGCLAFCIVDDRSPFRTNQAATWGGLADTSECLRRATVEMEPEFPEGMSPDLRDLCAKLLDKDPSKRLGSCGGANEIKKHCFFKNLDWEKMAAEEYDSSQSAEAPPVVPGKSLNIQDQSKIGEFDKLKDATVVSPADFPEAEWVYISPTAFQAEVVWLLAFMSTAKGRAKAEDNFAAELEANKKSAACTIL